MYDVSFEESEHKYTVDGIDYSDRSVTTILKHFGMCPNYDKFGNDNARDFGSAVHRVCEYHDLGDFEELDRFLEVNPALVPYLNGYKKYLETFSPQWKVIELPLVSKVWGFVGTPDREGIILGVESGVDLKSGSTDASHELQTAAYNILIEENFKIKVKKRYSLYLMQDSFKLIEHKNKNDRAVFLGLINAFNWKLKNNVRN